MLFIFAFTKTTRVAFFTVKSLKIEPFLMFEVQIREVHYTYIQTYMHITVYIHMYIYTYICTDVRIIVYKFVFCVFMSVYIHTCIHHSLFYILSMMSLLYKTPLQRRNSYLFA
jgi:hypothetical protein